MTSNEQGQPVDGGPVVNTDRHLWPDVSELGAVHESIFVTAGGAIGINVGGYVYVKPLREWHNLAGGTKAFLPIPDTPEVIPSKEQVYRAALELIQHDRNENNHPARDRADLINVAVLAIRHADHLAIETEVPMADMAHLDAVQLRRIIARHVRFREDAIRLLQQVNTGYEGEWPEIRQFLERVNARPVLAEKTEGKPSA